MELVIVIELVMELIMGNYSWLRGAVLHNYRYFQSIE